MALTLQQLARMEQRMVLSPQMQQAIFLLQVPLQELRTIIQDEMVQNPLLEDSIEQEKPVPGVLDDAPAEKGVDELELEAEIDRLSALNDEWKEYFFQDRSSARARYHALDEETQRFLENSISRSDTLSEHLLMQLNTSVVSDREKAVGEVIIGNIDENGYLTESLEEIARETGTGVEEASGVLSLIRTFHPPGVGARDLRECLLLQFKSREGADPLAREIISRFMDELAANRYPRIARTLKTTPERVRQAAEFIATLDPKPGRVFSADETRYVTPDIYLEKDDGEYRIIFNREYTPRLRISSRYRRLLDDPATPEKTREYIREKLRGGLWLIKNIRLRQETLYKLTKEIVRRQREFLDKGIAFLRPLKMTEIAPVVGIHESTVSRAVANKYIQTPRGTFPLRYFFTSGTPTTSGDDISSHNLKRIIEQMVKDEEPRRPLSDQEIVEKLSKQDITLARRTVAKYRKILSIPPSHLRKKY
ncbi:MAG: RNA polymerase factor sigma-54 [PVC group bacterium]